jgi:hypothetical protein
MCAESIKKPIQVSSGFFCDACLLASTMKIATLERIGLFFLPQFRFCFVAQQQTKKERMDVERTKMSKKLITKPVVFVLLLAG